MYVVSFKKKVHAYAIPLSECQDNTQLWIIVSVQGDAIVAPDGIESVRASCVPD